MSGNKDKTNKHRSRLSAAIHETAAGLHRIGLIDKATMREFDASCLTAIEPLSAREISAIRKRAGVSQSVFAHYLNVKPACQRGNAARSRASHRSTTFHREVERA